MKNLTIAAVIAMVVLTPYCSYGESTDPEQAAKSIIASLSKQQYSTVWDSMTSSWFKQRVNKDALKANMSMGRSALGPLSSTTLVSKEHTTYDPASGYQGDIYTFIFKDAYSGGDFYEKVVLIRDADGQYRMSGIFGQPAAPE